MAIPTNIKHVVTFKEQINHDRYDCTHANCSCGWHVQGSDTAAKSYAKDHIARHGGSINDASKTGELRPSSQGQGPRQAQKSEPVGGLRLVNRTETAPTPEGLRQRLETLKAANTAKLPVTTK